MDEINKLEQLIFLHSLDIYIGITGTFINLILLSVFFSKRSFLFKNKVLVLLAFGDCSACLGTFLLGLTRKSIYVNQLDGNAPEPQTALSCATMPFVWFRLWGAVLPSAAVLWLGIERLTAVTAPIFFRTHISTRKTAPSVGVVAYTLLVTLTGLALALARASLPVPYYCGRKATFSPQFSTAVYGSAICGYTGALAMNITALVGLHRTHSKLKGREATRQLTMLRYMVLISFISTMAVVVPNLLSVFGAFYGRLDLTVSEAASWLIAIKSSVNLFIYMALKTDFRHRVANMLQLNREPKQSEFESISPSRVSIQDNQDSVMRLLSSRNPVK